MELILMLFHVGFELYYIQICVNIEWPINKSIAYILNRISYGIISHLI